ncbi:MAG: insulinase family protein [Bacteroidetes bacterium]|nr:insulinase family protein [Bacteroidota bacterium]
MSMRKIYVVAGLCLALLLGSTAAFAQNLSAFERNVTEHTLANGMKFIIVERDVAPVATFMTFVHAGGVDEPIGLSGVAHIFEHMAFKGTSRIGTNNIEAERLLIPEIDATYSQWIRERRSPRPNQARMDSLWTRFQELEEQAKEYVVSNEFSQIIDRAGGVGLNAGTGMDFTIYFYSLPQNKAELWFSLEAERFKDPVMREFYVEKEVITEERRQVVESNPIRRFLEEFTAVAFTALPYRDALIGWPSDIESVTIASALEFYERFYVPSNMFVVIVGDVDAAEMIEFAELYFNDMPGEGVEPPIMMVEEPRQRGERRFTIEDTTQPMLAIGYKTVSASHPDALALDVLAGVLFEGRTSRMNRSLVDEQELALAALSLSGFPGDKHTTLFGALALPNQDVSLEDLEAAIHAEFDRLKTELVSEEELQRVITVRRANLLRQLGNNNGIANLIAFTQGKTGDWRTIFTDLDRMMELTPEDLQRVANIYFDHSQRTVGYVVNKSE